MKLFFSIILSIVVYCTSPFEKEQYLLLATFVTSKLVIGRKTYAKKFFASFSGLVF